MLFLLFIYYFIDYTMVVACKPWNAVFSGATTKTSAQGGAQQSIAEQDMVTPLGRNIIQMMTFHPHATPPFCGETIL